MYMAHGNLGPRVVRRVRQNDNCEFEFSGRGGLCGGVGTTNQQGVCVCVLLYSYEISIDGQHTQHNK